MLDKTLITSGDHYSSNALSATSHGDISHLGGFTIFHVMYQTRVNPQAYFWTPEWQQGEREAEEDLAIRNTQIFSSMDDAITWLESENED